MDETLSGIPGMIYLKNEKGLNAELFLSCVITEHALSRLSRCVQSGQASGQLQRFVALAMTLPTHVKMGLRQSDFPGEHDLSTPASAYGTHYEPVRGVLVPGSFKISPPTTDANKYLRCAPDPKGLGWEQVNEMCSLLPSIEAEARQAGATIAADALRKVQRKLTKSSWTIEQTGVQSMLSAECCVIYRSGKSGFIDHKSQPVDLPHARLFESPQAAQRAIDSSGWTDAAIVKVSVKIEGLVPGQHLPADLGLLSELLARRDAERLEENTPAPTDVPAPAPRRRF